MTMMLLSTCFVVIYYPVTASGSRYLHASLLSDEGDDRWLSLCAPGCICIHLVNEFTGGCVMCCQTFSIDGWKMLWSHAGGRVMQLGIPGWHGGSWLVQRHCHHKIWSAHQVPLLSSLDAGNSAPSHPF